MKSGKFVGPCVPRIEADNIHNIVTINEVPLINDIYVKKYLFNLERYYSQSISILSFLYIYTSIYLNILELDERI